MRLPFRGFFVVLCYRPDWRINVKLQNSMTKLRNLLRCYAIGMSIKSISLICLQERHQNTVFKHLKVAQFSEGRKGQEHHRDGAEEDREVSASHPRRCLPCTAGR